MDKGLKLSSPEKLALMIRLNFTMDDPFLVIKVNSGWVDVQCQAVADAVLDSIACFEMEGGHRSDEIAGGYRILSVDLSLPNDGRYGTMQRICPSGVSSGIFFFAKGDASVCWSAFAYFARTISSYLEDGPLQKRRIKLSVFCFGNKYSVY